MLSSAFRSLRPTWKGESLVKPIVLIIAALLTGCASTNPAATQPVSSLDDDTLCAAYHHKSVGLLNGESAIKERQPEFVEEIDRRGLIPDWGIVDQNKIRVGMTRCEALASWGKPSKINRASYGDQWVYCRSGGAHCYTKQYLYVRQGRVTSWN